MSKFRNKYRIETTRLKDWDYSSPGGYFITLCTKRRSPHFGSIENGKVVLNPIGEIVEDEWQRTALIRENVAFDEWIIMPNHLHGIIFIENNVKTPRWGVSGNKKWKPNSLGSIVNQFKSRCTKRIRASELASFAWIPRYHDHVIRDMKSLDRIRKYIRENPAKWELDEYYVDPAEGKYISV